MLFLFQCDSFVNQYTPEIVKLLLQEVGPNAVCAVLRLCTASMNTLQSGVTSVKGLCMSLHTLVLHGGTIDWAIPYMSVNISTCFGELERAMISIRHTYMYVDKYDM